MPINFNVVYGFKFVIHGIDSGKAYDFTDCITEALTIKRPRAEPNQPMGWSGSATLGEPLTQTFKPASLNNYDEPDPWKIGNIVKLYFYDRLFATCYLTEYFYNRKEGKGELSFEGSIGYWSYSLPQKDYKTLGFRPCTSTSIPEITSRFVGYANQQGMSLDVSGGLGSAIAVPPNFQGNAISQLQPYYGERKRWLCELPDGKIIDVEYPDNPSETNLILRLATGEVTDYEPQKVSSADIPKRKLTGTASVEKYQKCAKQDSKPTVQEEWDYIDAESGAKVWVLHNRTTTYPAQHDLNKTTQKTEIKQAKGVVSPEKNKGESSVVTTQVMTKIDYYDDQGRLIEQVIATDKVLCVALPEQFAGDFTLFNNAEKIKEEWKEFNPASGFTGRPDGVMRYHAKTITALFALGTNAEKLKGAGNPRVAFPGIRYILATKERIIETWDQPGVNSGTDTTRGSDTCNCSEYSYKKEVRQRENYSVSATQKGFTEDVAYWQVTGLNLKIPQSDSKDNDTPPAFTTKQAECPTCNTSFSEEIYFNSDAISGNYKREDTVSASTLQSRGELQAYLAFVGVLQHQRYRSMQIALPLPIEYTSNPLPFRLVGIGKRIYVIDSESISLGEDGIEMMFIGNNAGGLQQEIQMRDYQAITYYSDLTDEKSQETREAGLEPVIASMPSFEFILNQEV
jgi:hypothetical protein